MVIGSSVKKTDNTTSYLKVYDIPQIVSGYLGLELSV